MQPSCHCKKGKDSTLPGKEILEISSWYFYAEVLEQPQLLDYITLITDTSSYLRVTTIPSSQYTQGSAVPSMSGVGKEMQSKFCETSQEDLSWVEKDFSRPTHCPKHYSELKIHCSVRSARSTQHASTDKSCNPELFFKFPTSEHSLTIFICIWGTFLPVVSSSEISGCKPHSICVS